MQWSLLPLILTIGARQLVHCATGREQTSVPSSGQYSRPDAQGQTTGGFDTQAVVDGYLGYDLDSNPVELNEEVMYDPLPSRHRRSLANCKPDNTVYSWISDSCVSQSQLNSQYAEFCTKRCQNGRCVKDERDSTIRCQCLIGFEGEDCSTAIDPCVEVGKTCGVNGECIPQTGIHVCRCYDQPPNDKSSSSIEKFGYSCHVAVPNPCARDDLEPEMKHLAERPIHPLVGSHNGYLQCVMSSFVVRRCPRTQLWHQESFSCVPASLRHTGEDHPADSICARAPCLNGGLCKSLPTASDMPTDHSNDKRSFECQCLVPYQGTLCEQRMDMCAIMDPHRSEIDAGADKYTFNSSSCGPNVPCVNTNQYPYFACVCPNSIVSHIPCDRFEEPVKNRCGPDLRRYVVSSVRLPNLWIECDDDDVGFLKECPNDSPVFDEDYGVCRSSKDNAAILPFR